jgi:hypothetical protein
MRCVYGDVMIWGRRARVFDGEVTVGREGMCAGRVGLSTDVEFMVWRRVRPAVCVCVCV